MVKGKDNQKNLRLLHVSCETHSHEASEKSYPEAFSSKAAVAKLAAQPQKCPVFSQKKLSPLVLLVLLNQMFFFFRLQSDATGTLLNQKAPSLTVVYKRQRCTTQLNSLGSNLGCSKNCPSMFNCTQQRKKKKTKKNNSHSINPSTKSFLFISLLALLQCLLPGNCLLSLFKLSSSLQQIISLEYYSTEQEELMWFSLKYLKLNQTKPKYFVSCTLNEEVISDVSNLYQERTIVYYMVK